MLTQEDLQAIQTMLEKTITPITERLNRIEGRLENVEERLEKVKENTEITRGQRKRNQETYVRGTATGESPGGLFYFRAGGATTTTWDDSG